MRFQLLNMVFRRLMDLVFTDMISPRFIFEDHKSLYILIKLIYMIVIYAYQTMTNIL